MVLAEHCHLAHIAVRSVEMGSGRGSSQKSRTRPADVFLTVTSPLNAENLS